MIERLAYMLRMARTTATSVPKIVVLRMELDKGLHQRGR